MDTETSTIQFFVPEDVGPRDWGRETLVTHAPGLYTGKVIEMHAGKKGGLQLHRRKDESAYVLEGKILLRFDPGDGTITEREIGPGDSARIPPGTVHQMVAITKVRYFEVSTPHFNDRVRVEEEYGEEADGGLQTTEASEIEFR